MKQRYKVVTNIANGTKNLNVSIYVKILEWHWLYTNGMLQYTCPSRMSAEHARAHCISMI